MRSVFKFLSSRIVIPSDAEVAAYLPRSNDDLVLPIATQHVVADNHITNIPAQLRDSNINNSTAAVMHTTRTRGRSVGSFDYNESFVPQPQHLLSPTTESSESPSPVSSEDVNSDKIDVPSDSELRKQHEEFLNHYYTKETDTFSSSTSPSSNGSEDEYLIKSPTHTISSYGHRAKYLAVKVYRSRFKISSKFTIPLLLAGCLPVFVLLVITWLLFVVNANNNNGSLLSFNTPPPVREISGKVDKPFVLGCMDPLVENKEPRANAVLVVLARNKEIDGVLESMRTLERHWNRWFHYPYVMLNDQPFNSTFKEAIRNATESDVQFGLIEPNVWNFPEWADEEDINEGIAKQGDRAIMYGGMASYHRMCRFYSGAFYDHPLLASYDWYWRVEPEIKYFCDITYDPFKYMEKNNKVYGFTIVIKELVETVPNLFRHTYAFKKEHNITSKGMWEMFLTKHEENDLGDGSKDSGSVRRKKKLKLREERLKDKLEAEKLLETLPEEAIIGDSTTDGKILAGKNLLPTDDSDQILDVDNYDYLSNEVPPYSINGETYNMCHFWSNFEIARLDFYRSKEYRAYFEALDRAGGFWTERWGDAPVHSLAAGLFLAPEQVHYFRDIGYRHTTIQHCPANAPERQRPSIPFVNDPNDKKEAEENEYWSHPDPEVMNGVGCRCRCDTDVEEVELKDGSCLPDWVELTGGWV